MSQNTRWTQEQLDAYNLRRKQSRPDGNVTAVSALSETETTAGADSKEHSAITCERDQHDQLMKWADSNGIIYIHSRMDKATSQQVGEPDFYFMRRGKVVWVEMKFKTGKVSNAQAARQELLWLYGVPGETFWTVAEAIEFVRKNL